MDTVTSTTSDTDDQTVANQTENAATTEHDNNPTPPNTPLGETSEDQQGETYVLPAQILELIDNPLPDLSPEELVTFKHNLQIIKNYLNAYAQANNQEPFIFEQMD
jgi:hypothetical protein